MRFAVRGREAWSRFAMGLLAALLVAAWARAADKAEPKPSVEEQGPAATEAAADDPPPRLPNSADEDDRAETDELAAEAPADASESEPPQLVEDSTADAEAQDESKPEKQAPRKPAHPGLLATAESEAPAAERQIDAASIKGIEPGKTTRDELHAKWGKPKA
ncbi:MAG TPA: hypothetical protein VGZ26_06155, partial [Pirellulales bacterium]|nr:hypothetical protein [Pirellulales bacterium]